jgi:hypothetical protein
VPPPPQLPFPFKLHEMLDDAVTQRYEPIVSWLPHGKAFRVHQPKEFADMIMPRYFKQSKYKSFQRQLYIYGYRRINSKSLADFGAYYHEMFVRGEKDSSLMMQRQSPVSSSKADAGSKRSPGARTPAVSTKNSSEDTGAGSRRQGVNANESNMVRETQLDGAGKIVLAASETPHIERNHSSLVDKSGQPFTVELDNTLANQHESDGPRLLVLTNFQQTAMCGRSSQLAASSLSSAQPMCPDLQHFQIDQKNLMQRFNDLQSLLAQTYGGEATNLQHHTLPAPPPARPPSPFTQACNAIFD